MSSGEVRRVSRQDIQLVQNLIERCLQLYMNQQEVVDTLLDQAKIEPGFTELVWQKLEEENREFFRAYHLRLMVKQQIDVFNKLLAQQVNLMHRMQATGVASLPVSNGSSISQLQQSSSCFGPDHTGQSLNTDNVHPPMVSSLPTGFTNGGSTLQPTMQAAIDMSMHARRIGAPSNLLSTQSSDIGIVQGMNGGMIKSEPGYSGNIPFMFGGDGNVLETRAAIGDSSFNNVESNSEVLNEPQPLLDADTSTFGFLRQIPRNFSLSDLTAGFSHGSDILESYPRSPFLLATDTDHFLDSRERGDHQGDNRRLDSISEYENFVSD